MVCGGQGRLRKVRMEGWPGEGTFTSWMLNLGNVKVGNTPVVGRKGIK